MKQSVKSNPIHIMKILEMDGVVAESFENDVSGMTVEARVRFRSGFRRGNRLVHFVEKFGTKLGFLFQM